MNTTQANKGNAMDLSFEKLVGFHQEKIKQADDQLKSCPQDSQRWWRGIRTAHRSALHFIESGGAVSDDIAVDSDSSIPVA